VVHAADRHELSPADSVEYAELELYLTSFAHGKPMNAGHKIREE
jgi:hypothetical protein